MTEKKRHTIKSECPECGCGLIGKMTPDIYREKFGDGQKTAEIVCPMCGKKHEAVLTEEE